MIDLMFFPVPEGMLPWQPILGQNTYFTKHLLYWHSKTNWNIAMLRDRLIVLMIALYRVKIW